MGDHRERLIDLLLHETIHGRGRPDLLAAAILDSDVIRQLQAEAEMLGKRIGWREGFEDGETMAKRWGHVDSWEDYPANPYLA
jgi:hypothetical protein